MSAIQPRGLLTWPVKETYLLNAVSVFRCVDQDWCTGASSDESGTTATLSMIQEEEGSRMLTVAHVGDTRAIQIRKDGSCALS